MKNLYLLKCALLCTFGTVLQAQTFKNIHRQNLPVLRIPTELIDKVETVDVNGVKNLKIIPFFGEVTQIPLSEIDSITHYLGSVNPAQLGVMRTASVMGVVRDTSNAPINNAIVRSIYGGEETHTDLNGVFFLNNINVYDKLGYISITKPGFHQGSRSFLPLEQGANYVNVQLLPFVSSGFVFSAADGGQVTAGALQISFPPNAIQLNGQPYNGVFRVYAQTLDPTSTAMFDQMPGDLIGGLNNSLRLLRSFGMASIELRDLNMQELQLAEGSSATLTFNIPTALQAEAPPTIDWWSFDEILGYWKHEGVAQKQGNQYIGSASHFSWWNLDVPETFNEFYGTVNSTVGDPISNAQINLVSPTLGTVNSYTNIEGQFSGRVPRNQNLTLNIYLPCSTTNYWALAETQAIQSVEDSIVGSYTASLSGFYPITGTVVNCQSQPISDGYVSLGSQVYITNQGEFTIQTCATGQYIIQGFDLTFPDSIKVSDLLSIQVGSSGADAGNIQACSQYAATVTDIDGNTYPTLLIGAQLWTTENLKTTRFANGSVIPNVIENATWAPLTTPAWCNYNNALTNDSLYGKLYNGWAAVSSSNLCPTGWHVPTISEWVDLSDYLGGLDVAGGKMKSVDGWSIGQGVGGTNSSGFSCLPGGYRNLSGNGSFGGLGGGYWWSSTGQAGTNNNAHMTLYGCCNYVSFNGITKKTGMSIRCIKD